MTAHLHSLARFPFGQRRLGWLGRVLHLTVLSSLALGPVAPQLAYADAAEDAKALSDKGVEAFKKGDFAAAVGLFEQALQLQPGNPFYLRYAGRAWLALSHYRKAQPLLDVYLSIEKDEKNRKAIDDLMAPWRKKSPREVADALYKAAEQFPMAGLESDCAKQYEDIGDEPALEKATQLWEWAASRSRSPATMQTATEGKARVEARLAEVRKVNADKAAKAAADKAAADSAAAKAATLRKSSDSAGLSKGAQIGLYAGGGVLLIGGAALAYLGMSGAAAVDDDAKAGLYKGKYDDYLADRDSQGTLHYVGIGAAVVGVGLLGYTVFAGGSKAPAKGASWQVAPQFGPGGTGLAIGGQF